MHTVGGGQDFGLGENATAAHMGIVHPQGGGEGRGCGVRVLPPMMRPWAWHMPTAVNPIRPKITSLGCIILFLYFFFGFLFGGSATHGSWNENAQCQRREYKRLAPYNYHLLHLLPEVLHHFLDQSLSSAWASEKI